MTSKFVILHHVQSGGEHWDLMIEQGDVLMTWQLWREPVDASVLPIRATRIGDHRKAYLEYEGPIGSDRGHVRRVDAGSVRFLEDGPNRFKLILMGKKLRGRLILFRDGDDWILQTSDGD